MKRYIYAIIQTILTVLIPLVMIPFLQWYKRTFCEPNTDLAGIYMLLLAISIMMIFMSFARWISAIQDKDIKDLLS